MELHGRADGLKYVKEITQIVESVNVIQINFAQLS